MSATTPSATNHESATVTAHTTTPIASPQLYNTSRLPKLEPQSFWDSYEMAVDTNPTLSPIHKFNYLKAQRGTSLPLTEMNYAQSVILLKQLINAHTHALIELPGPTNELCSLQLFHDITENHISGLAALGVSKHNSCSRKLPVPVRRNLARDHDQLRWTLDDLQAAVVKEIRVLESGLHTTDSPPSLSTRTHATASFYAAIRVEL